MDRHRSVRFPQTGAPRRPGTGIFTISWGKDRQEIAVRVICDVDVPRLVFAEGGYGQRCVLRKQRVVPDGAVLPDPPDPAAAKVPEEIHSLQGGERRSAVHMAACHGAL